MRPPICAVCFKRFSLNEGGGTVAFADYEPLPDGIVGHPKGLEWFCAEHIDAARLRKDKTSTDATLEIRQASS